MLKFNKENTETSLLQATFKLIKGTSTYPTLTQQDITNGGTLYQYEFARFRKTDAGITEFTDRRTFLNFDSIYDKIEADAQELITQIQQELQNVEDGSAYLLKSGGTANGDFTFTGNIIINNLHNSSRK